MKFLRVCIEIVDFVISITAEDFNSITIRTPSLLDSSLISLIPSMVLLLTTSAILSKSLDLFCKYGFQ